MHFNVCADYKYKKSMGETLNGTVFSASLWGGGDTKMTWLDGMTGCKEQCNLAGAKMSMSNFKLDTMPSSTPKSLTT